jgi:hypothetical protein
MNDATDNQPPKPPRNDDPAPSGTAILVFFTIIGLVLVGGYFLATKLIDISRQEDCMLAGRRNCAAPIVAPAQN